MFSPTSASKTYALCNDFPCSARRVFNAVTSPRLKYHQEFRSPRSHANSHSPSTRRFSVLATFHSQSAGSCSPPSRRISVQLSPEASPSFYLSPLHLIESPRFGVSSPIAIPRRLSRASPFGGCEQHVSLAAPAQPPPLSFVLPPVLPVRRQLILPVPRRRLEQLSVPPPPALRPVPTFQFRRVPPPSSPALLQKFPNIYPYARTPGSPEMVVPSLHPYLVPSRCPDVGGVQSTIANVRHLRTPRHP
jgi:hypothetical protein